MQIKEASIAHFEEMHKIRMAVKENILSDPNKVTKADYDEMLNQKGKGWICELNGIIIGFAIIDIIDRNIWALFIHPEYEKLGAGTLLHQQMMAYGFSHDIDKFILNTAPGTKAEQFYLSKNWKKTGVYGNGDVTMELAREDWTKEGMD